MSDHYDRYNGMDNLLSTNLAEVGTDCSEFPNNSDAISREAVADAINGIECTRHTTWYEFYQKVMTAVEKLPPIQPEPHWIPVTEDTPDEERECWITPKTTSKVYRGVFTRHYGECHRTGFICDEGFMWLNSALAWMYCEAPEPYKGVTE